MSEEAFDVVVVGAGPAGQKAAVQAAKHGKRVLVVERDALGGACVHRGTIPSKTLRETAMALTAFRRRCGDVLTATLPSDLQLASLTSRLSTVVSAHQRFIGDQLGRNGITSWKGRARFVSPHELDIETPTEGRRRVRTELVVLACGSRPRLPPGVPIDHEHVFDSDSVLSMTYLPESLTVLGGGIIACEYASIFAALGVRVTMVDRGERPLSFLDRELVDVFVDALQATGARFLGRRQIASMGRDGMWRVAVKLEDGEVVQSEKVLVCLGRVANLDGLELGRAGLEAGSNGFVAVDEVGRTCVPHIYAAGDIIGPPSLASVSMEQGRRAMRHALGLPLGNTTETLPIGVYTIPEIASVGLSEDAVVKKHGRAVVGRARFAEIARGQIAAVPEGLLKLVTGPDGRKLLGAQIVGEGACELIHLGQMALVSGWDVDGFVENIFNFPTLAEAYRVAALDIVNRR